MKAYDVRVADAYKMLGKNASNRVAKELVNIIQSMSDVYPNTDNIPSDVFKEMISSAIDRS